MPCNSDVKNQLMKEALHFESLFLTLSLTLSGLPVNKKRKTPKGDFWALGVNFLILPLHRK
jgi:hypothetical protein